MAQIDTKSKLGRILPRNGDRHLGIDGNIIKGLNIEVDFALKKFFEGIA